MPPVPVPFTQVELLVQRWFPRTTVTIEQMGSGVSTPVYRLTTNQEISYLRLGEEPGEDRSGEVAAHRLALEAGVAVPTILRSEALPPELDRSAALTSAMPGIPLAEMTVPVADATIIMAATDLARFNAIPVQGYGWIDGVTPDGCLCAEHPTRAAWAGEYQAAVSTIVSASILPDAVGTTLTTTIRQWSDLPERGPAALVHGDFDPSHIYVDPTNGTYQGLIDLGEIRGADPLYDLGHLLAHAFDPPAEELARRIIEASTVVQPIDQTELRLQAIAIASRSLAIQLSRPQNAYRTDLITRLVSLLTTPVELR